jgi:acetylornithine deacetylase
VLSESVLNDVNELIDGNREDIVAFLQKLVRIPSVTGDENAIQAVLLQELDAMGLETDSWDLDSAKLREHPAYIEESKGYAGRPNVVGKYAGVGKGKSLLFNGHVDVVPPGDLNMWKVDPWSGEIVDGKMYGRGVSDMKSGVAAMTMAMKYLLGGGYRPKGDIFLEYVVDEEDTGNGTLSCVQNGYGADAGICCETSSMCVQPACIGRIWWEIHVDGFPAGIQKHFDGVSAIDKAYEVVQWVKDFEAIRMEEVSHPLYPDIKSSIPCMVTVIDSGSFCSSFPDYALLKGSFATVPGEDTDAVKKAFSDFLAQKGNGDPWLRNHQPRIVYKGYCGDSADIPVDHPIVETLSGSFRKVMGKDPVISGRQGAADTRYLIKYGNTPTVIFGPGLTEQMHSTNEYMVIDDLIAAIKILAATILEWCGFEKEQ